MVKIIKSIRNIKLTILLFLICAVPVQAMEVTASVTEIKISRQGGSACANIVLNDNLAINEIKIKGDIKTGNISLKYPDYVNKLGRSIPQVEIVNENLAETIRSAVVSGVTSPQKQVDFNYKITKISLLRQKDRYLKAFVEVLFNKAIRVEARVMESKTGFWVAWPGRKGSGGRWEDQFKVLNRTAGQALEEAIIEKYKVVRSEEP